MTKFVYIFWESQNTNKINVSLGLALPRPNYIDSSFIFIFSWVDNLLSNFSSSRYPFTQKWLHLRALKTGSSGTKPSISVIIQEIQPQENLFVLRLQPYFLSLLGFLLTWLLYKFLILLLIWNYSGNSSLAF